MTEIQLSEHFHIKSKIAVTGLFYLFYRFLNSATADRLFPIYTTYQYTAHTFVLYTWTHLYMFLFGGGFYDSYSTTWAQAKSV